jgi:hydroxyacylglutathione hydrolase
VPVRIVGLTAVVPRQGEATIPSTLQLELDTNPFLRPQDSDIRATLRIPADAADVDAFAAIRKAKDNF